MAARQLVQPDVGRLGLEHDPGHPVRVVREALGLGVEAAELRPLGRSRAGRRRNRWWRARSSSATRSEASRSRSSSPSTPAMSSPQCSRIQRSCPASEVGEAADGARSRSGRDRPARLDRPIAVRPRPPRRRPAPPRGLPPRARPRAPPAPADRRRPGAAPASSNRSRSGSTAGSSLMTDRSSASTRASDRTAAASLGRLSGSWPGGADSRPNSWTRPRIVRFTRDVPAVASAALMAAATDARHDPGVVPLDQAVEDLVEDADRDQLAGGDGGRSGRPSGGAVGVDSVGGLAGGRHVARCRTRRARRSRRPGRGGGARRARGGSPASGEGCHARAATTCSTARRRCSRPAGSNSYVHGRTRSGPREPGVQPVRERLAGHEDQVCRPVQLGDPGRIVHQGGDQLHALRARRSTGSRRCCPPRAPRRRPRRPANRRAAPEISWTSSR